MKVLLILPPYWVGDKKPLGYIQHSTVPLGLGYVASMPERAPIGAKTADRIIGCLPNPEASMLDAKFRSYLHQLQRFMIRLEGRLV